MKFFLLLSFIGICWAQYEPHTENGRTAIVHLFEWRWADSAKECERYLAPNGFGEVQVSPPNENLVVNNPSRPWWERYQPISYKICSRSGNEDEFRDMVTRCNNVGVRDCRMSYLLDLALEKDYVRTKMADYMNHLIDIGVAGFRIDAAKHIWPGDIQAVLDKLHNLNTKWFPQGSRPSIIQEVVDLGGDVIKSSEYFGTGRVTEFKYGISLGTVIRKWDGEKMAYLRNWGEGWGLIPSDRALVFVDNHDNQQGHGVGGSTILTFWDARLYKMAVGFMLAHPYGFTRVMPSYYWPRYFENGNDVNNWFGPPNDNGATKEVTINEDTTCGNGWVCEHRWRQISNMIAFRNEVNGQPLSNWWDNGSNQVAFGRGNKGFIVFKNDDWSLSTTLQTGIPEGTYCDVISGDKIDGNCTGIKVYVSGDGTVQFSTSNTAGDPFIAIHVESKL
ncbi:Alpha-amylase 1 [Microtus ochrogaster]|uniref:alpha-amylase n=1 Tax=Microtus ochrogaster TaxID=79684 RepID=A0A8J6KWC4_MICOH|nr:Alpha-amylase 1 [Microtus ochrogaster]